MDFATKVLRSLSLGTGGKMTLSSEEAVVGVSVGIKAIAGGSYPRWWWDGRGDAAVCLDAFEEAEEIDERVLLQPTPGKVGHVLKACGHRLYIERRLVLYEINVQDKVLPFLLTKHPPR